MSNWKNVNGHWMNFDMITEIWVREIDPLIQKSQYCIYCEMNDETIGELFDEVFDTRKEAQDFLDKFMSQ